MEADSGGRTAGAGMSAAQGTGAEGEVDSLRETNARLVDTLQQLQRERAGDALEGVLAEVDRAIGGMLTYVEDLRRTREKLVRGVGSVADRLAEIDTRAVLGPIQSVYEEQSTTVEPERGSAEGTEMEADAAAAAAEAPAQPTTQPVYVEQPTTVEPERGSAEGTAQPPTQSVYVEQPTKVEPGSAQVEAGADVADVIRPEAEPEAESAAAQRVHEEEPAMVEPTSADDAEESGEDERRGTSLPVDLVVHGCRNFELVGKLQAKVSGLAVVESMRVRRFHRGSLYMMVSHGARDLPGALGSLEVDGKRLRILESGAGRIEATFPG